MIDKVLSHRQAILAASAATTLPGTVVATTPASSPALDFLEPLDNLPALDKTLGDLSGVESYSVSFGRRTSRPAAASACPDSAHRQNRSDLGARSGVAAQARSKNPRTTCASDVLPRFRLADLAARNQQGEGVAGVGAALSVGALAGFHSEFT